VRPKSSTMLDAEGILASEASGRRIVPYEKKDVIFSQGEAGNSVFYLLKGRVELSVVSSQGKEAVIGILEARTFFGENCLGGEQLRIATATALTSCSTVKIGKSAMTRLLHEVPSFAEYFASCLLTRNMRFQEDLIDQLFNSSEIRLARALLLLAGVGKEGRLEAVLPKVNQQILAEMIGTSRQRVNHFMNKFRKLGLIEYNHKLLVHSSLLELVLHH
jgi:CRP/FNR family transcriptional regulator, cyclic AMP receptor protein